MEADESPTPEPARDSEEISIRFIEADYCRISWKNVSYDFVVTKGGIKGSDSTSLALLLVEDGSTPAAPRMIEQSFDLFDEESQVLIID